MPAGHAYSLFIKRTVNKCINRGRLNNSNDPSNDICTRETWLDCCGRGRAVDSPFVAYASDPDNAGNQTSVRLA